MQRIWASTLIQLGILAMAGLLIGSLYDKPLIGLLIATLIALGWQLLWLFRLDRWLRGKRTAFLPEGSGLWARVFARIEFVRRRSRRRGKRFKALVKQLRQATRSFPDGGIILNGAHEIVVFNQRAQEMLGLKKQDRGLRVENLIRDPVFVQHLRSEIHDAAVEIASPLQNGRWLSFHLVPYGLDQKLLLVRDVSRQRQADEMRRDFVANASHELRTPLTVITGYLDALADDPGINDDLRSPIEEMQKQSLRMRLLVDDLLTLSTLESGSEVISGEPVNIQAIIDTAKQEAQALPNCPESIAIHFESDADLRGDSKDIQSVVSNLVSNAVRYTPQTGRIDIYWRVSDEGVCLVVSDTGKGIAKEHIPRLTERFYRVENGRERIGGEGGTGLGLAIVKHALMRHDAVLDVTSTVGSGSTFTCRFPAERIVAVA